MFVSVVLIPACASSSLAFVWCIVYELNKQSDNIEPWYTPFPILNQSVVLSPVLTVASWPAYRFLRGQVWWLGIPISLTSFQFVVIHTVKVFHVVNEADIFLKFPCFLSDPTDIGNLASGSSAFSKSSLYIWMFSVHVLLKLSLKDFEHYLPSMWSEHNCMAVCTFFGTALLWDWNENWPFTVRLLLSFPNLLTYWVQHFNSIIF